MKWKVTVPMCCVGHDLTYVVEADSKKEAQKLIVDSGMEPVKDEPNYEGFVWEDAKFEELEATDLIDRHGNRIKDEN